MYFLLVELIDVAQPSPGNLAGKGFSTKRQQKGKDPKSLHIISAPALTHLTAGHASPGSGPSLFPGLCHFLTHFFFVEIKCC